MFVIAVIGSKLVFAAKQAHGRGRISRGKLLYLFSSILQWNLRSPLKGCGVLSGAGANNISKYCRYKLKE